MTMDWFRFYSETIRDSKIRRVARKANQSPAHVIGVWSILLSMASESSQRGTIALGDNPVTLDDIEDVTGCNVSETLHEMLQVGMLAFDGTVYSIPAWGKRQYESDNSTKRVQKHRDKVKQEGETILKRFGNGPDTDSETETELDHTYAAAVAAWEAGGQMLSKTIGDEIGMAIDDWRERGYPEYVVDAIKEAALSGKLSWKYVEGILKRCAEQGTAPTNKHTGKNGSDPKKPIITETVKVDYGDGTFGEVEVQTRGT